MKRTILLIFIWISVAAAAQTPAIDSLENLIKNDRIGNEQRIDVLMQLARKKASLSPDDALENGLQALALAERIQNKRLMADAAKIVGINYYRKSDFSNALDYFNQALQINIELNNEAELAPCYNNIGLVYNQMGYYDLALQNHLNQLKVNEALKYQRGMAISHLHIGNVYNNIDENDNAILHYLKSRDLYKQIDDSNSYANTSINLGVASMELEKYKEAEDFFNEALLIKKQQEDEENIAKIYSNFGLIRLIGMRYDEAIAYLEESMTIYNRLNNKRGVLIAEMNMGEVKLNMGLYAESFNYLQSALRLAEEIDSKKDIERAHEILSKWYAKSNNFEKALEHYKTRSEIRENRLSAEKGLRIKSLQIVYEVEKKEKEILKQKISIERLKTGRIYFWLALLVIFIGAIILYYRYLIKRRLNRQLEVKIAEALRKQNEQQQVIVHQSSLTSLGELASGIAHEIKQPLQNISLATESLQLENKEDEPDRNFVNQTINDIHDDVKRIKLIIGEISKFSRGQQMQIEELFDVNKSIEKAFLLARTKFSDCQISVDFCLGKGLPKIRGNPYKFEQVVVNFFNNAKDAIEEKAEKAGTAFEKQMKVKSCLVEGFLNVEVIDNGIGIPDQIRTNIFLPFYTTKSLGKGTGLGLSISLGIAKEMGGTIELESEEMKGSLLRLKVPINRAEFE
jgi:two-component system, NtrC family, sensor kinase